MHFSETLMGWKNYGELPGSVWGLSDNEISRFSYNLTPPKRLLALSLLHGSILARAQHWSRAQHSCSFPLLHKASRGDRRPLLWKTLAPGRLNLNRASGLDTKFTIELKSRPQKKLFLSIGTSMALPVWEIITGRDWTVCGTGKGTWEAG